MFNSYKAFCLFLWPLITILIFCPGHVRSQTDSESDAIRILFKQATQEAKLDSVKATGIAEQALRRSLQTKRPDLTAEAMMTKASVLSMTGHEQEAIALYDSAASFAAKRGLDSLASSGFYDAGLLCFMRSRYAEALGYFMRDLKITEKSKDSSRMATLYNDIGVVYENLTDYASSSKYHDLSLRVRRQLSDSAGIALSCNNLGMVSYHQKDYSRALWYHEEALRIRKAREDFQGITFSLFNLSNIFFAVSQQPSASAFIIFPFTVSNSSAEVNLLLLDSALSLRHTALKGARQLKNEFAEVYCLKGIGEIMVVKKQYEKAREVLLEAAEKANRIGMQKELSDIYLSLYQSWTGMRNAEQALRYYKLYAETKDSVFNMQSARRIAELQTMMEVDKKQQEIAILNLQAEAQDREIRRQKLIRNMTLAGILVFMVFSIVVFVQRMRIAREKKISEDLLLNILPRETAEELKHTGKARVRNYDSVSVLFTDFKNFTGISASMSAEDLVAEINYCFSAFDKIISGYSVEKIKTIGDSYMCAAGLPSPSETHAYDLVCVALEIRDFMLKYRREQQERGRDTFEIRIGVHTGQVVSGIVGTKKFQYDLWGDTVNIASRMESSCDPGKVNISESTYQRVQHLFKCESRGMVEAKNRGMIKMYFVESQAV